MSLPKYAEYKESGVTSLGLIPSHWQVKRLRFAAELNPSKSEIASLDRQTEISFLPMDAIGDDGTVRLDETRTLAQVENGYTYFRDGDVVIAKITPCFENGKGAVIRGLLGGVGFGTTELIVVRPRHQQTTSDYLGWLFASPTFRKNAEGAMYGAGGQKRVPDSFVRDYLDGVPPIEEQSAIVAFLDRETGKIDALIAEQEKLLTLLAEKRQATISHAVTRGLNPNAPMKDSGVPWLGEVPAHWNVTPLKYLVSLKSGGTPSKENLDYWDGEVPWASARDLKSDVLSDTTEHITAVALASGASMLLPAGVVLVVVRGMILARTFPVTETLVPMAINQDLKAVLPKVGLNRSFLAWLLRGTAGESLQRLDEAGHGTKALRMDAWTSMRLPVPLEPEQKEIVAFIVKRTGELDSLAGEAEHAIALLKERRSALIAAAVTGKIDVRAHQ